MTRLLPLPLVVVALLCLSAGSEAQGLNVYLAASSDAVGPGDWLSYTLMVANNGSTALDDVRLELRFPGQIVRFNEGDVVGAGLDCDNFSNCDPNGNASWNIGILSPGQTRTIIMPTTIAASAGEGTFVLSPAVATATGSNEVVLYNDVLLGDPLDLDPPAAPLDLAASVDEADVTLTWTANTESDLAGYRLYRRLGEGDSTLVASPGIDATSYTDDGLNAGTYTYRLSAVDMSSLEGALSNEAEATVANTASGDGPLAALRVTAAPNPAVGAAHFLIHQPEPGRARLAVYDALGREVALLLNDDLPVGEHAMEWDAVVPAGVYLWRFTVRDAVRMGTVTVVR